MPRLPGLGDIIELLQQQTAALIALPETLRKLDITIGSFMKSVKQGQDTIARIDRLTKRADELLGELEVPIRALAPGLTKVAKILEDPAVDALPELLARVQAQALPVLRSMELTQAQVANIAGTTERLMSMVDDVRDAISSLPGAAALARRRKAREAGPTTT
jgi:ABC-type transporter Mla subunit MlaD